MDKLRFLHIPKTAGSTFARILRKQYGTKHLFVFTGHSTEDKIRFSELPEQEKRAVRLFMGHAPLVSGIEEADHLPIITILREPVSRVKSFCQFVSEGKVSYLRDAFPAETFDLDEFLASGNSELSNLQSRMLINYEKKGTRYLIDTLTAQETTDKALDNLFNKVKCYGLQEYFDESLIRFASELGWNIPHYEYRNKKNQDRLLKFEDRHLEKIVELNSIDIAFYGAARERFEAILDADVRIKQRCDTYKRVQKYVAPLFRIYGNVGRYLKRKGRTLGIVARPPR